MRPRTTANTRTTSTESRSQKCPRLSSSSPRHLVDHIALGTLDLATKDCLASNSHYPRAIGFPADRRRRLTLGDGDQQMILGFMNDRQHQPKGITPCTARKLHRTLPFTTFPWRQGSRRGFGPPASSDASCGVCSPPLPRALHHLVHCTGLLVRMNLKTVARGLTWLTSADFDP